jgi:hypothetical protein
MGKYPELPLEPDSPEDRREFLRKCGRFAAVTPPAMTMLLSVASKPTEARASVFGSSNNQGQNQGGNQGGNHQRSYSVS